jgi:hypothetical protein
VVEPGSVADPGITDPLDGSVTEVGGGCDTVFGANMKYHTMPTTIAPKKIPSIQMMSFVFIKN